MLQILFIIIILSIAAFCINLLFFLNDSYEYEYQEIRKIQKQFRSKRNYKTETSKSYNSKHNLNQSSKYCASNGIRFHNIACESNENSNEQRDNNICA